MTSAGEFINMTYADPDLTVCNWWQKHGVFSTTLKENVSPLRGRHEHLQGRKSFVWKKGISNAGSVIWL